MGRSSRTRTSTSLDAVKHADIPSKRQLEIELSKLSTTIQDPKIHLEQYPVSAPVAAELLYMAGFEHNDIVDRNILDLGTGTGRLAIGASLLGAKNVIGIDLDPESIRLAKANANLANVIVDWRLGRVEDVSGVHDTVLMNPPYGTRIEHADTLFLDKAFESGSIIYTIHKSTTRGFIKHYVENHGRKVDIIREMELSIPHLYSFHRRKWGSVQVDLYRIIK